MGVPRGKLAAIAEPPDVAEVCGRLLQSGHPRIVHQCESRPALAQQLGEVRADPTPVAYLNGVSRSLRQFPQESVKNPNASDVKSGGSWRSRGPSLSPKPCMVRTKPSASLRLLRRFLSCVRSSGNLAAKRNPRGATFRQRSTVAFLGVP